MAGETYESTKQSALNTSTDRGLRHPGRAQAPPGIVSRWNACFFTIPARASLGRD